MRIRNRNRARFRALSFSPACSEQCCECIITMEACGGGGGARDKEIEIDIERDFPLGSLTSMRCSSSPHTNSTRMPLLSSSGHTHQRVNHDQKYLRLLLSNCMNALACLASVCLRLTRTFELLVDVYLWASHAEAADCRYPFAVTKLPINLPTWPADGFI